MSITPLVAFFTTLIFIGVLGMISGYFLYYVRANRQQKKTLDTITAREEESRSQAFEIIKKAQDTAERMRASLEKEKELLTERQRLVQEQEKEVESEYKQVQKIQKEHISSLEEVSGLSQKEALELLRKSIESEYANALASQMRKLESSNKEALNKKAQEILVTSIQRYGNSVENDIVSTMVKLASEDAKGKIIGKEGRNIKAFERASGVQLVIDDTPNTIMISSFDPIRRVIAKHALDELLADGRVQPARIESVVEQNKHKVEKIIKEKGQEAADEVGVVGLSENLLYKLGALFYRYSYGQNVLQHSVEMAHIAGMLADQVGADAYVAKMGALLHDIGKADDHTVEGSHVDIGRSILRKEGIDIAVIQAMQSHHEEYPYETVESILVQVADSISGGRPGARSDVADMYLKKLDGVESIAQSIEGVEEAYALSAGREIRIFVNPTKVDDYQAKKIAREVAERIEQELKYPGEIKVHVIRETKIVDYAK